MAGIRLDREVGGGSGGVHRARELFRQDRSKERMERRELRRSCGPVAPEAEAAEPTPTPVCQAKTAISPAVKRFLWRWGKTETFEKAKVEVVLDSAAQMIFLETGLDSLPVLLVGSVPNVDQFCVAVTGSPSRKLRIQLKTQSGDCSFSQRGCLFEVANDGCCLNIPRHRPIKIGPFQTDGNGFGFGCLAFRMGKPGNRPILFNHIIYCH